MIEFKNYTSRIGVLKTGDGEAENGSIEFNYLEMLHEFHSKSNYHYDAQELTAIAFKLNELNFIAPGKE